ncbi:MAG: hypothetical protein AAGJ52_10995 [Pseudomonadota bacterium]
MKTVIKTIATAALLTCTAATAFAQDYNNWGVIDPYGMQMQDQWGNVHYVDPYAYDSQVDMYGNVISSYHTNLDPSLNYYDLQPVQPSWNSGYSGGYSSGFSSGSTSGVIDTYVPYTNPSNSHESFINAIWE